MYDVNVCVRNLIVVFSNIWIVNRYWGSFFEKKKISFLSIIIWIFFGSIQYISQHVRGDINVELTCINAVLILIIAICGYECAGAAKYFLVVLLCVVWALAELLVFFLLSSGQMEREEVFAKGTIISILFMILFVYIISVVWDKSNNDIIPIRFYAYLVFMPFGSICIAIIQFYSRNIEFLSTVTVSILLLFNMIIFEIYTKLSKLFIYEKENMLYTEQINIISGNTTEQKKILEEYREEKHNLLNELLALQGGIEKKGNESVKESLNKIIEDCSNIGNISKSGNSTIDAIINFKYMVAREHGIDFQLKIFVPQELPIDQCDIGVILGNALDNAIEAASRCKTEKKQIEISMSVKKEAWIMRLRNPYEHEIRKNRDGEIISNKEETHKHGFGLKSIKRIAKKYFGEAIIDIEDNIFLLTVVLNFK